MSADEGRSPGQRAHITAPASDHVAAPAPRVVGYGTVSNTETMCNEMNPSAICNENSGAMEGPSTSHPRVASGDQRLPGRYQRHRGNVIDVDSDTSDDDPDTELPETEKFDKVNDLLGYRKVVSLWGQLFRNLNLFSCFMLLIILITGVIEHHMRPGCNVWNNGLKCLFVYNFNDILKLVWMMDSFQTFSKKQSNQEMKRTDIKLMMKIVPMMMKNEIAHHFKPP